MSSLNLPDDELILRYQGFVRAVAMTAWKATLGNVELDDLISYGQVGLLQAARSYDPKSDVEFATYAYYRVRGAIFDGYASMQWLSRAQYRRIRSRQLGDEVIEQQAFEESSGREGHSEALWTTGVIGKLVVVHLALEAGERGPAASKLSDPSEVSPSESLELEEAHQCVRRAVAELPDEERSLVEAIYFKGQTLTAAANVLGKSKSWASRLHDRALERLLRKLQTAGVAEAAP
jgi:RNA polymerase sigma factor for flagellar operon FliA